MNEIENPVIVFSDDKSSRKNRKKCIEENDLQKMSHQVER